VRTGRVGFLAFDARHGGLAGTLGIAPAPDPQTIALRVPDFRTATHIVITNAGLTSAQVDILDAAILLPR
jgi:hypothetical protein